MSRPLETLAQRLRAARRERGLTQAELAQAADLDQPLISKIEQGTILQTTGIARLAEALGVNVKWLEQGIGDRAPAAVTTYGLTTPGTAHTLDAREVAHHLSYLQQIVTPTILGLQEVCAAVQKNQLPEVFTTAMEDAAIASIGTAVVWSSSRQPKPGQWVLVADRHGRIHARVYRQGAAPDEWIAHATDAAYASFNSTQDGLSLVATRIAVFDDPLQTLPELKPSGAR